jgi:hypothetical protein
MTDLRKWAPGWTLYMVWGEAGGWGFKAEAGCIYRLVLGRLGVGVLRFDFERTAAHLAAQVAAARHAEQWKAAHRALGAPYAPEDL